MAQFGSIYTEKGHRRGGWPNILGEGQPKETSTLGSLGPVRPFFRQKIEEVKNTKGLQAAQELEQKLQGLGLA
jgi:hypothetical protein